jgi:hypothetical protein
VPSDLSNRVLRPLQLCKQRLDSLIGIADINQEVAEAEALETDAFSKINDFIEQSQKQPVTPSPDTPATKGGTNPPSAPPPVAPPTAKKVVSTTASELTRRSGQSGVIETAEDVNAYVDALKSELMVLVDQNTKVRLK